jgi:hypothetical protein
MYLAVLVLCPLFLAACAGEMGLELPLPGVDHTASETSEPTEKEASDAEGGASDAGEAGAVEQEAAETEQEKAIRRLREEWGYSDVNATFFVMSAMDKPQEVIELFLAAGLPVDAKNENGETPLYAASWWGNTDVALLLIEKGADVNVKDSIDATILHRVASNCKAVDVVQALLDAGADVTPVTAGGATAYQIAEASNCTEIQELLKNAGAQ